MKKIMILFVVTGCMCAAWISCKSDQSAKTVAQRGHWIEIKRPSVGLMYMDSVPLQMVMKITAADQTQSNFRAYLVGFKDSVLTMNKTDRINNNKYYQYDMQHDWVAIAGDNTFNPVFYHPRVTAQQSLNEGILVFETDGSHPDTLVYNDSHGSWGIQKFILKGE